MVTIDMSCGGLLHRHCKHERKEVLSRPSVLREVRDHQYGQQKHK